MSNLNEDSKTIAGFADEWQRFDQSALDEEELKVLFDRYFSIFPWPAINGDAVGFDMGCGSGRWAKLVAPRVGWLHCVEPSDAIDVAKKNLHGNANCSFHKCAAGQYFCPIESMDFGYSLGVLHHVPDTAQSIKDCVKLLKPGAPFLLYLYYSLDNRGLIYRLAWRASDLLRGVTSRMPHPIRYLISQLSAFFIYWPLARLSRSLEILGFKKIASRLPLSPYSSLSFYTMRTDALDRFGTRLEKRFAKKQIQKLMEEAGLENISFSETIPYWVSLGYKS